MPLVEALAPFYTCMTVVSYCSGFPQRGNKARCFQLRELLCPLCRLLLFHNQHQEHGAVKLILNTHIEFVCCLLGASVIAPILVQRKLRGMFTAAVINQGDCKASSVTVELL